MAFRGVIKDLYPYFVANKPILTSVKQGMPVINKFNGKIATHVSLADAQAIKTAVKKGVEAEYAMKELPTFQRKEILLQIANEIRSREDELAHALTVEVGKPIKDSKVEVGRAVDTFTIAAEESVRIGGDYSPMDISLRNKGFSGITHRFPIGLLSMIVPFNFPINLAAHKIGPAIAAGCPFILKPSERTPWTATILGEILSKTSLPEGAFSILPTTLENAKLVSESNDIKLISFTGSAEVGWRIKNNSGKKRVTLELGGNAACVVDHDCKNLDLAADRIVFGSFYQAGQSCISVQRIYVHEKIYDSLKAKLVERTKKLVKGDPMDPNTFVGPLISEQEAIRVENWVNDAVKGGAKVVVGGKREGAFYDSTILENVSRTTALYCKEVFGPVCILEKFSDFKVVCDAVNDSAFGLQTGIFTENLNKAFYAFKNLHVGGVIINDIPSARVDSQPYGGIKDSGLGREGLRYAIEDFTELKVMIMKDAGKLD